jgi:hypothetical protein
MTRKGWIIESRREMMKAISQPLARGKDLDRGRGDPRQSWSNHKSRDQQFHWHEEKEEEVEKDQWEEEKIEWGVVRQPDNQNSRAKGREGLKTLLCCMQRHGWQSLREERDTEGSVKTLECDMAGGS